MKKAPQKSATLYNKCCIKKTSIAVSPCCCPTKKEAQKILHAAQIRKEIGTKSGIRDWIFVYVALNTGLRVSEFSWLKERNIVCSGAYYKYIQVSVSKTYRGIRIIPINHQTFLAIKVINT